MNGGQARDRVAAVDPRDESGNKTLCEIHRAVANHIGEPGTGYRIDLVDVSEAIGTQQLFREILWREAGGRYPWQAHQVTSSAPSATRTREPGSSPAAPAREIAVSKRRRVVAWTSHTPSAGVQPVSSCLTKLLASGRQSFGNDLL